MDAVTEVAPTCCFFGARLHRLRGTISYSPRTKKVKVE